MNRLTRIRIFFQPKILRLLALGLVLCASLLLLIQENYGTQFLVALGPIRCSPDENIAEVDVLAAIPRETPGKIRVSASKLLLRRLEKYAPETEFFAVIQQRGERLIFERIYALATAEAPALQGPRWVPERELTLAVGTKPELVAMVGLDMFGYQLSQPVWAKRKLPGADMVYYQAGSFPVKEILDGIEKNFIPDMYILDGQNRIVGVRKWAGRLLTLPEFLRQAALSLYGAAVLAGLGSLLAYKWPVLVSTGRRIWDQVSMRGRKASK